MAFIKHLPQHLEAPGPRFRAQVRVERTGCSYPFAYRAEGLCGMCGRVPMVVPNYTCERCKSIRRIREAKNKEMKIKRESRLFPVSTT